MEPLQYNWLNLIANVLTCQAEGGNEYHADELSNISLTCLNILNSAIKLYYSLMYPTFIILLCLMLDNFTCQRESTGTQ
jgi:AAA+ ATPase superfamily predicted ATPase